MKWPKRKNINMTPDEQITAAIREYMFAADITAGMGLMGDKTLELDTIEWGSPSGLVVTFKEKK